MMEATDGVPAGNASREEWATYARDHLAATDEDLVGLSRDDLKDKYTSKGDPIQVVRYVGGADAREISEDSWLSVGVKQKTSRWERSNAFKIPAKDFSKDALVFLDPSGDFVIEEA